MLWRFVEKSREEVLKFEEECCREVLDKSDLEKCWTERSFWRSVAEKGWTRVVQRSVGEDRVPGKCVAVCVWSSP